MSLFLTLSRYMLIGNMPGRSNLFHFNIIKNQYFITYTAVLKLMYSLKN